METQSCTKKKINSKKNFQLLAGQLLALQGWHICNPGQRPGLKQRVLNAPRNNSIVVHCYLECNNQTINHGAII
jgi:hypothetical protein